MPNLVLVCRIMVFQAYPGHVGMARVLSSARRSRAEVEKVSHTQMQDVKCFEAESYQHSRCRRDLVSACLN